MKLTKNDSLLRFKLAITSSLIIVVAVSTLLYLIFASKGSSNTSPLIINCEISLAVITLLAVIWGTYSYFSIKNTVNKIRAGVLRVANGDFSQKITVNNDNEIAQFAEYINNMAERLKDSYRRLAIERQRDEVLLFSMSEGLLVLNEKSEVALINKVAVDLLDLQDQSVALGRKSHDVLKLYPSERSVSKQISRERSPDYQAILKNRSVNNIYSLLRNDNKVTLVNVNANPIKLENKAVGAIIILRDVTKEREIDRMKTEFLSLATHQLRTPLSALRWYSDLLLGDDLGKLNAQQEDAAQNVLAATEHMTQLINSLLNISRIESGRLIIDSQPTDLSKLVEHLVDELKIKAKEKHQKINLKIEQRLPIVSLDSEIISQVYINLITNSIKYTKENGEINIAIYKDDKEIVSQISDNGYGIPKNQQNQIFQKFFRANNAIATEAEGTGLGLYLIKSIIESVAGKIWFESSEGAGTTFWFAIPLSGMKSKEGEVKLNR